MPGTNLTREEAQERARLLTVDAYEVDLDLSGAQEGGTYRSVTTVRFDSAEAGAETFIDLVAPAVHDIVLNGKDLDIAAVFRDSRITLKHLRAGANELKVVADCSYTNTGEGLHRFVDPVDEQAYLYTQFEVPDARRVFASFEQPDLKATFRFTVKAPSGWTVISNSPTPEPKDDVWSFEPTPRISTYITALIAGPYHSVHSSYEKDGQSVPLGIYCFYRHSPSTSTPTRSSRSRGRASTGSRRSSTTRTPSPSTTSSSSRSSTRARWRTRARSPSATSTCSVRRSRTRPTRRAPRRSSTSWPTCGSATWSPWSGGTTSG